MNIIRFSPGDLLELKKPHPCGSSVFRVVRSGSDVRLICTGCGRDMTLDRLKVEKAIKKVLPHCDGDRKEGSADEQG